MATVGIGRAPSWRSGSCRRRCTREFKLSRAETLPQRLDRLRSPHLSRRRHRIHQLTPSGRRPGDPVARDASRRLDGARGTDSPAPKALTDAEFGRPTSCDIGAGTLADGREPTRIVRDGLSCRFSGAGGAGYHHVRFFRSVRHGVGVRPGKRGLQPASSHQARAGRLPRARRGHGPRACGTARRRRRGKRSRRGPTAPNSRGGRASPPGRSRVERSTGPGTRHTVRPGTAGRSGPGSSLPGSLGSSFSSPKSSC